MSCNVVFCVCCFRVDQCCWLLFNCCLFSISLSFFHKNRKPRYAPTLKQQAFVFTFMLFCILSTRLSGHSKWIANKTERSSVPCRFWFIWVNLLPIVFNRTTNQINVLRNSIGLWSIQTFTKIKTKSFIFWQLVNFIIMNTINQTLQINGLFFSRQISTNK